MSNGFGAGSLTTLATDVLRTPVYVEHLVDGIARLVEGDYPGIHHVAGSDWVSMYDFALAIADGFQLDRGLVIPAAGAAQASSGGTESGEKLGLDCARTFRLLGLSQPRLAEGIAAMRVTGQISAQRQELRS